MAKPAFDPTKPFEAVAKPKFDPSKPFDIPEAEKGPGLSEQVETASRSALEGITLGLSEPAVSGINAVVGNLIRAGFDSESIGQFAKEAFSSEAIKQEYAKDIARRKTLEAAFPEVAIPSEIAGGVLSGFATGGLAQAGKLAPAAKVLTAPIRAVEAAAEAGAGAIPTLIGKAATRGAISAGGAEALKGLAQVPTGVSLPEEVDVLGAAKFGGLLGGGIQTGVSTVKGLAKGAKKIASALGGVNEEAIEAYLKDPGALTRAKSPEQIKDSLDNFVDQLQQGVEQGKINAKQAQDALDSAKTALKDAVENRKAEFQVAKFDAAESVRTAQGKLNQAIQTQKADTQASLTGTKLALRDQAVDAVSALKEKVKAGSAQSYKILERSGKTIEVKPAIAAAKNALKGLKVQGKAPTVGASAQAYKKIQNYVTDLKRYKNLLSTKDAKKKIQQLDQDWIAAVEAGDFTTSEQQALRAIRAAFDQQLKSIPEYAQIMQQVSADTDLLARANKAFGTLEKAGTKIARIDLDNADLERQLLTELGSATQRPFDQKIIQLRQVGIQLRPGQIEARLMGKPVGLEAAQAERVYKGMTRPGALEQAVAPIEQGALAETVAKAQQKVLARQLDLQQAQQKIKDLGPFARPLSNISAIKTAVTQRNPEYNAILKTMSQMSGEDFVQYIDDLRLAEQFQKEFRIGSRNVNLWGLGAGATVYAFTGDPTSALVIAGLGGGFGSMVDRFGPKMTQKVLDKYLEISGMPTMKKIDQAFKGLPKEVVSQLKQDFVRSVAVSEPEEVQVDASEIANVAMDVRDSDLSSIKKAKMLQALATQKPISSTDLAAVMLGAKARPTMYIPKPDNAAIKMDKPDVLKALEERSKR